MLFDVRKWSPAGGITLAMLASLGISYAIVQGAEKSSTSGTNTNAVFEDCGNSTSEALFSSSEALGLVIGIAAFLVVAAATIYFISQSSSTAKPVVQALNNDASGDTLELDNMAVPAKIGGPNA